MTKEITINQNNWTGKETTITLTGELSWNQYDYELVIKMDEDHDDTTFEHGRVYAKQGWDEDYYLCSVYRFTGPDWWSDPTWTAHAMEIYREHKDPRVAAAQVLCNTL